MDGWFVCLTRNKSLCGLLLPTVSSITVSVYYDISQAVPAMVWGQTLGTWGECSLPVPHMARPAHAWHSFVSPTHLHVETCEGQNSKDN